MLKRHALCLGISSFSAADDGAAEPGLGEWCSLPFAEPMAATLHKHLADLGYAHLTRGSRGLGAAALGESVRSAVCAAGRDDVLVVHVLSHGHQATTALYAIGADGRY